MLKERIARGAISENRRLKRRLVRAQELADSRGKQRDEMFADLMTLRHRFEMASKPAKKPYDPLGWLKRLLWIG